MTTAATVARYLLGAMLFVLGLNGFLNFIPQPAPPEAGGAYLGALVGAGVLPVVKAFEVVIGLLLLLGRFVPLALVMLVPIAFNIVLYHAVFDLAGGVAGFVVAALTAFLLWAYSGALKPLLVQRARPFADEPTPPQRTMV